MSTLARDRFEIGAACRSLLPQEPSGDAFDAIDDASFLTVVIVDGVGHGPLAHAAARAAVESIRASLGRTPGADLCGVLRECHLALRGTPGAAVGLCRFDPERGNASYVGVGNTSFLRYPNRSGTGVSLPGIVGFRMRTLRTFDTELVGGDLYVFHTDGVSRSLDPSAYARMPLQFAAKQALGEHGKLTDDAAVFMLRFRANSEPSSARGASAVA